MLNSRKIIAGTLLLAFALTADGQMSRAPMPPNTPKPPPGGPPLPAPPQAGPGPTTPGSVRHVQRIERFAPERARTLVIPSAKSEHLPNVAQIEEDLNVMSRILEKAANVTEDPVHLAMGIALEGRLFGNAGGPRNMFIEDYGALFMLTVPFPLAALNAAQSTDEPKADPNSEWETARRELQSGSGRTFGLDLSGLTLPRIGAAQPYDEGKVDDLKDNVLKALKNAVHIRALDQDDEVTVIVTGARPEMPTPPQVSEGGSHGSSAAAPASRLVFQVKRADLDELQKGDLNLEEIRKKVKVSLL